MVSEILLFCTQFYDTKTCTPLLAAFPPLKACLLLNFGSHCLLIHCISMLEVCGLSLSWLNKDPLAFIREPAPGLIRDSEMWA